VRWVNTNNYPKTLINAKQPLYQLQRYFFGLARVSELAQNSGISQDLVFADRYCVSFGWPDEAFQAMDNDPIAAYPDIPANMPGVKLDCSPAPPAPTATPTTTTTTVPDWAQLAQEAIHDADLGEANPLPPTPEVIIVNDEDDTPFLPADKKTFSPPPKIEPDSLLPTTQMIPQSLPSPKNH
jgi:hypothetical protein